MAQFQEHLSVIAALKENYKRPEDAAAVASVVRSQQNAAAACSQREDEVKVAIKGAWAGARACSRCSPPLLLLPPLPPHTLPAGRAWLPIRPP